MSGLLAFMRLAAKESKGQQPLRVETRGTEATIYVYDVIGKWYIEATDIAKALAQIGDVETLNVRINSPGGDVIEARAIMTHLNAFKGTVIAHVDGWAASAASILMLASDEVRITKGAFVMIHNPWTFAIGDAREMRKTADILDKVTAELVGDYVEATEQEEKQIREWMDDETWFTAEEAVAAGFAHEIVEGRQVADASAALAAYAKAPKPKPAPATPDQSEALKAAAQDRERHAARLEMYERFAA